MSTAIRRYGRKLLGVVDPAPPPPVLDVGLSSRVVAICHPEWRGILAATAAFGVPVFRSADLDAHAFALLDGLRQVGADRVVVSGYVPGVARFSTQAREAGVSVKVLFHSSMAQHGDEQFEGEVISEAYSLLGRGLISEIGFIKAGQAEAFRALGYPAVYVPPAIARPEAVERLELSSVSNFGIFGEATGRKNVATQVGAVAILGGTSHVNVAPVAYLAGRVVEHPISMRSEYLRLVASMDLNLNVSLYECFPVAPQESFILGVPCLISRTSVLFRDDAELWEFVTVPEHDNPSAIATAASRLMSRQEDLGIVNRAKGWMHDWNTRTEDQRMAFLDP